MKSSPSDLPERLLEGQATDFERRLLETALRKQPSRTTSARIAGALGVTVTSVEAAGATKALSGGVGAKVAAAGTTAVWPWISVGVVGLVVAGVLAGASARRTSPAEPRHVSVPAAPPATMPLPGPTPSAAEDVPEQAHAISAPNRRRVRAATPPGDLREQIALVDAARAAVAAGADRRALEVLGRYADKYPLGNFRPEASALEIEVLFKLGRESEARPLAQRFVIEHRGSLLAVRVATIAGLPRP
jgi:hypothetical protein